MEIFKRIKDFNNYEISNLGRVRNISRNSILVNTISKRGYYTVKLCGPIGKKSKNVHRLIGIYFLNNGIDGDFIVDHIDNNPLNNRVSNLEWISRRDNLNHGHAFYKRSSKYPGVYLHKQSNKWRAMIWNGIRSESLGLFKLELDASIAYQNALKEIEITACKTKITNC